MHDRRRVLALPVLLLGLLLATPLTAQAAPVDGEKPTLTEEQPFRHLPADQRQRMERQAPLVAAAQRLSDRIEAGDHRGFTGVALTDDGVSVYWKGTVPATVKHAVAQERTATLHAARYSITELKAAEKRALAYIVKSGGPVYGVRVPADGSGLVARSTQPLSAGRLASFQRLATGDEVALGVEVAPAPAPAYRENDFAPYYGGGRILNPGGGSCSSGFAVQQNGVQYLLTAGHCGWPGGTFYNGDGTRIIGTGAREHVSHDILLINASAAGRIFDGGGLKRYEDRPQFTKAVSGWNDTFPNEWVCQSGMTSGAQCNIRNTNNFSFSYSAGNETYTDLILAFSGGGIGARPGDSGGPVFTLDGAKVTAKGTISGASTYYPIRISYNGKCLDADANRLNTNGTRIQLWDCNNSMQQNFVFANDGTVRSATNFGYCLDADLGTIGGNGTNIQLWQCNGQTNQQWKFNGSVAGPIRSAYNDRCLDADAGSLNTNGTKVQLWDCNNTSWQSWGPQTYLVFQDFRTTYRDFGVVPITQ